MNETEYSFNSQDYEVSIRLYNGINDVYLTNTAWDDLYLEDNIFDIFIKGSIVINTPFDSLERESEEILAIVPDATKEKIVYKFRNDGRDTLYISIKPKNMELAVLGGQTIDLSDEKWLLELETVIYDVRDMAHGNPTDKKKTLFFWEKTYQMMLERDSDFSTANTGTNEGKSNQDQVNDTLRSQTTGGALASLLLKYDEFKKHAQLVTDPNEWNNGSDRGLIYHTSPINAKVIDDLLYLYDVHISDDSYDNQPCLLKLERAKSKGQPKQFSLKPFRKYFEEAGKSPSQPGKYQLEHYFIQENAYSNNDKVPTIPKAPLEKGVTNEIKADEFTIVKQYQIVDLVGGDYYKNLANRRLAFYNATNGQFNIDSTEHKAEQWKQFYTKNIAPSILTQDTNDRLPLTPYIRDGLNTTVDVSILPNSIGRYVMGRNRMLRYYLFSNLGISFSSKGLTFRQPGRFFGLSKQTLNDKEFDHKLEGQYLTTQVIHHFSNTERSYYTQMVGVKTHMFKSETTFESDDLILISESSGNPANTSGTKTSTPETPTQPPINPTLPTNDTTSQLPPVEPLEDIPSDPLFNSPNPQIPETDAPPLPINPTIDEPPIPFTGNDTSVNPDYPLFPPLQE